VPKTWDLPALSMLDP